MRKPNGPLPKPRGPYEFWCLCGTRWWPLVADGRLEARTTAEARTGIAPTLVLGVEDQHEPAPWRVAR